MVTIVGSVGGTLTRTARIKLAEDIIKELKATPKGLTLEHMEALVLPGVTHPSAAEKEWAHKECKKAIKVANRMFKRGKSSWSSIKAGPDNHYHVIVEEQHGRNIPQTELNELVYIDDHHIRRWKTQTASMQQVHVAYGQKQISEGSRTGNPTMVAAGEAILNHCFFIHTGLSALGLEIGEHIDTRKFVNALMADETPTVRLLFYNDAKIIDQRIRDLERDVSRMAAKAAAVKQIYSKGSMPLPPAT